MEVRLRVGEVEGSGWVGGVVKNEFAREKAKLHLEQNHSQRDGHPCAPACKSTRWKTLPQQKPNNSCAQTETGKTTEGAPTSERPSACDKKRSSAPQTLPSKHRGGSDDGVSAVVDLGARVCTGAGVDALRFPLAFSLSPRPLT